VGATSRNSKLSRTIRYITARRCTSVCQALHIPSFRVQTKSAVGPWSTNWWYAQIWSYCPISRATAMRPAIVSRCWEAHGTRPASYTTTVQAEYLTYCLFLSCGDCVCVVLKNWTSLTAELDRRCLMNAEQITSVSRFCVKELRCYLVAAVKWTTGFRKRRGVSYLTERLSASQGIFWSTDFHLNEVYILGYATFFFFVHFLWVFFTEYLHADVSGM
jgi:hypothetical protein